MPCTMPAAKTLRFVTAITANFKVVVTLGGRGADAVVTSGIGEEKSTRTHFTYTHHTHFFTHIFLRKQPLIPKDPRTFHPDF